MRESSPLDDSTAMVMQGIAQRILRLYLVPARLCLLRVQIQGHPDPSLTAIVVGASGGVLLTSMSILLGLHWLELYSQCYLTVSNQCDHGKLTGTFSSWQLHFYNNKPECHAQCRFLVVLWKRRQLFSPPCVFVLPQPLAIAHNSGSSIPKRDCLDFAGLGSMPKLGPCEIQTMSSMCWLHHLAVSTR